MSMIRGSFLGFIIGVLPGAGATIASLMSYTVEKSASKEPEKFGKGAMAGLVGPEAANNAASAGAMVPLLTLGIPGSAATAVLLAAFLLWGLRPGPLLMTQNPEFAWGLIASMYLGNVALLALNIFAIPMFVQIVRLPYRLLAPAIVLICTIGTYSVHASMIETWLMLAAGVVGFFMKLLGFSPAATVLALVLGPLAEEALRQSLTISRGSFVIFIDRPVSLSIILTTMAILLLTPLLRRFRAAD
jgi:putative tricarboxylic transport membrane protein